MGDATPEDVIAALDFFAQVTDELVDPEGRSMHNAMRTAARLLREAQRDVDAAARLRAAVEALLANTPDFPDEHGWVLAQWIAPLEAAAVGSVDPEGEATPAIYCDDPDCPNYVWPARPSVCPTCGSDDPEVCGWPHFAEHGRICSDAWHSPDRGDRCPTCGSPGPLVADGWHDVGGGFWEQCTDPDGGDR